MTTTPPLTPEELKAAREYLSKRLRNYDLLVNEVAMRLRAEAELAEAKADRREISQDSAKTIESLLDRAEKTEAELKTAREEIAKFQITPGERRGRLICPEGQKFFNEMYATLIDPVGEHSMSVEELCEALLEAARHNRERLNVENDFNISRGNRIAELESALTKMHDLITEDTQEERGYSFYSWQRVYQLIEEQKRQLAALSSTWVEVLREHWIVETQFANALCKCGERQFSVDAWAAHLRSKVEEKLGK